MEMQTENKVQSKQRIQFDFTQEALQRLEDLKEKVGASTKAEVVRNALKLYEWFVQIDLDDVVEIQDKDGKTIYRIPAQLLLS